MFMEKAAIYLRLSKEDVEKQDTVSSKSIENQRCILEEYAKSHHFLIYKIYMDDDYSGLSFERPAFLSMLADASKHNFSVILAKSQSRLSRNMEHAEYLLHDLLPTLGIRFIGVVDGVDTAQKAGKKVRQINALVNEWYSEDLSESIRAVYRRKMKAGEYLGAYAPYGYRKDISCPHRLTPYEPEAVQVRKIFQWYLKGWSIRRIACKLEEEQVLTPASNKKAQSFRWSPSTIQKILGNVVYIGSVQQRKSERKSFKDKKILYLPASEWITVAHMHEAIIDDLTFEAVQQQKKRNRRQKGTNHHDS